MDNFYIATWRLFWH